ncbi:MAG: sensor histidine kinase [Bradyrhizobium sp.]|nr:sensor histidine kinase [Bradyrhizobium sp.]
MMKWLEEIRRGWRGISPPPLLLGLGFATLCLALATLARWSLSLIRPDVFFTPYIPAVFFATAVGGAQVGALTALAGGALGLSLNFGSGPADFPRLALLLIFWAVSGLIVWGIEHYRSIAAQQRQIAKRLIEEEEYRKLVVAELQHRLKNQLSVIHAVLHQVLDKEPQIWSRIDHRMRALVATDDLIARVDGSGCDIRDLLLSELGPYGHVRVNLNGDPLFLPAKLAVSLALIFHELATNAAKYGALSNASGKLDLSWSVISQGGNRLLHFQWRETGGPRVRAPTRRGFGTALIKATFAGARLDFAGDGLRCEIDVPLGRTAEAATFAS